MRCILPSLAAVALLSAGANSYALERPVLPVRTISRVGAGLSVGAGTGKPALLAHGDSLRILAEILPAGYGLVAFGDTDHDGFNEITMNVYDLVTWSMRILEHQGNDTYEEVQRLTGYTKPYAVCDLDQDNRSEILGQDGARLVLYESSSPTTHPMNLVWSSPALRNVIGFSTTGDTDRDGKMEIIHSINTFSTSRFVIYENKGDDTYVQVFYDIIGPQDDGRKVIADLDGDGLTEIAFSGTYGYLHVYESPENDVWQETFFDSTGLDNAYGIGGGVDTDGNGRPELFVVGDRWVEELRGPLRFIYVYEAACSPTVASCPAPLARIAVLTFDDQHIAGAENGVAVANVDAIGRPEVVMTFFRHLIVYRAVAPGQWNFNVGAIDPSPNGIHNSIYSYDVNRNGRPELFWVASGNSLYSSSLVLEHPGVPPTGIGGAWTSRPTPPRCSPNPARDRTSILFADPSMVKSISLFDVAGHCVARRMPLPNARDLVLPTDGLPAGIYFLRLESPAGTPFATARLAVVR